MTSSCQFQNTTQTNGDWWEQREHTLIFKIHSTTESFLRNFTIHFPYKDTTVCIFVLFPPRNVPTWSGYVWTIDYTNILLIPKIRMCIQFAAPSASDLTTGLEQCWMYLSRTKRQKDTIHCRGRHVTFPSKPPKYYTDFANYHSSDHKGDSYNTINSCFEVRFTWIIDYFSHITSSVNITDDNLVQQYSWNTSDVSYHKLQVSCSWNHGSQVLNIPRSWNNGLYNRPIVLSPARNESWDKETKQY